MSIQPTHGNQAVHHAQANHQPTPASQQPAPTSALPQDKVTISPEAQAKAASMGKEQKVAAK